MSRSSNSPPRFSLRHLPGLRPRLSAGIAFSRDGIRCAVLEVERAPARRSESRPGGEPAGLPPPGTGRVARSAGWGAPEVPERGSWGEVRELLERAWPEPLFSGPPPPEAARWIADGLSWLRARLGRTPATLQVALPDPLAIVRVFKLEALPRSVRARRALMEWRLARELEIPPGSLTCAIQDLGHDGTGHLLLGIAVPRGWSSVVETAFLDARWPIDAADLDVCHAFNHLQDGWTGEPAGGAALTIRPAYWSLLIWDEVGRPRLLRSGWLPDPPLAGEPERLACETEQVIRSCAASEQIRIGSLRLIGSGPFAAAAVGSALNARLTRSLRAESALTPFGEMPDTGPRGAERFAAALSAAIPR